MTPIDPEITVLLLARGFIDLFDRSSRDGAPVHQDSTLPWSARRSLALLSGLCLEAGTPDLGSSVHDAMALACRPLSEWRLPQLYHPFRYADAVLVDGDLGVPTDDCRALAAEGGAEVAMAEDRRHEVLRAVVSGYPMDRRDRAYAEIREFVVRNPATPYDSITTFIINHGHVAAAQAVVSFYRRIPQNALFGETARLCGGCGGLLWPDRDAAAFPNGRCRVRQCRLAHPSAMPRGELSEPDAWRVAVPEVLAFWVGPGLDEIRIYDALKRVGRAADLYPLADAADVGIDGLEVGIDVKTYASPVALAAKLTRSVGRLAMFRRKLVVVPDDKSSLNPRYIEQLRSAYQGTVPLEFMSTSAAIRELAQ